MYINATGCSNIIISFIQYIPSKGHRFGIKTFIICDCKTGYVLDSIVYTEASTEIVPDREFEYQVLV
jgi:hypothetical protein